MMKKITFYIALFCLISIPSFVHGADFYFTYAPKRFSTGETQIVLKLRTGSDSINAVAGKIEIPDGLKITKINTGTSAVLVWIDQPKVGNVITFSGITPGGFQGDVQLFSFGYTEKDTTPRLLKVTEGEVIKNDGLGTSIVNKSESFKIGSYRQAETMDVEDVIPPEVFTVVLGKEDTSFDGAYFASFSAQDKNSGIQRYEWAHTLFFSPVASDWQETTSPIVLTKYMYFQKLFVKAIDGEGNARIVSVNGPYHYAVLWIGIILVLTLLCVLFFARPSLYRSS